MRHIDNFLLPLRICVWFRKAPKDDGDEKALSGNSTILIHHRFNRRRVHCEWNSCFDTQPSKYWLWSNRSLKRNESNNHLIPRGEKWSTCVDCFVRLCRFKSHHTLILDCPYINTVKLWNPYFTYQAQASDQFLATTKLATNKAICLKTEKINKSKLYL
jgi:hypothetical protein